MQQATSDLQRRLGLQKPLVLAPMAGGVSTPALAAAVSEGGGLGSLGAAYLTPHDLRAQMAATRALTRRPFAVNLFAPHPLPEVQPAQVAAARAELAPLCAELGLAPPTLPEVTDPFEEQFAVVLEERPAVFSFAFGRLQARHLTALRSQGIVCIGTATSLAEARELAADGVDAVVVQGGAAGGHRGGWQQDDLADTVALARSAAEALPVPVLAAGGLMTRADVRAALDAGASLVQCGTAFLRAAEAGTSAPYRAALAGAAPGSTTLTRSFSGRLARGLTNTVTEQVRQPLPYPYQNALTRPLRNAAAQASRAEFLSLWAGEGFWQGREAGAAEILEELAGGV